MKKTVLIIAPYQFGELSDCYYWAKYAKDDYNIVYFGYRQPNSRLTQMQMDGVKIWQPTKFKSVKLFGIFFYFRTILYIIMHNIRDVIICNMPKAEILAKVFKHRNIILDIRTMSVDESAQVRKHADDYTRRRAKQFKRVSAISNGVINSLHLNSCNLLPLGAEELSHTNKVFDKLRLMYIGTLNGRKFDVFLDGLLLYKQKFSQTFTLDIIGTGDEETTKRISSVAKRIGEDVVMHGYKNHQEAKHFFDTCNVGICFVPMTQYFEHQPATKLYEYTLSGMAVVATNTYAIKHDFCDKFGVLTDDNAESVCDALFRLSQKMSMLQSSEIVMASQIFHWKYIVNDCFKPLFR